MAEELKIGGVSFLLCLNQSVESYKRAKGGYGVRGNINQTVFSGFLIVKRLMTVIVQYLLSPVCVVDLACPFSEVLLPFLVSRRKVVIPQRIVPFNPLAYISRCLIHARLRILPIASQFA